MSSQQDTDSGGGGDVATNEIVLSGCQSKSYHFKCDYRAFERANFEKNYQKRWKMRMKTFVFYFLYTLFHPSCISTVTTDKDVESKWR